MKLNLKALVRKASVDIKQNATRQDIETNWHTGVMYGDLNVFDAIYENDLSDQLAKYLKVEDYQECYLGYSKQNDTFYMGFDVWNPRENAYFETPTVVSFELSPDGVPSRIKAMIEGEGSSSVMFYGRDEDAPLKTLQQQVPDLLDIRLG